MSSQSSALFDANLFARIPTETWVLPRPRPDAYVGGLPLHFEQRLWKLFGCPEKVLHPFGGLAEIGGSVDLNETTAPTVLGRGERGAVRNAAAALGRLHE
jgi:hypothetical protein